MPLICTKRLDQTISSAMCNADDDNGDNDDGNDNDNDDKEDQHTQFHICK